jgi:hypothetical protein
MDEKELAARRLFEIYGRLNDEAMHRELLDDERKTLAGLFAANVVGSSPQGVVAAEAARLPYILKDAQAEYRKVGGRRFIVTDVRVTDIDAIHVQCAVDWRFGYVNAAGKSGNVDFTNLYYLTFASGSPKIFAFITPDEGKAMREHGLA